MKIDHSIDKPTFSPVTITFELETPEELATLWHLLNAPAESPEMRKMAADSSLYFIPPKDTIGQALWKAVDMALNDSGLRELSQ